MFGISVKHHPNYDLHISYHIGQEELDSKVVRSI